MKWIILIVNFLVLFIIIEWFVFLYINIVVFGSNLIVLLNIIFGIVIFLLF